MCGLVQDCYKRNIFDDCYKRTLRNTISAVRLDLAREVEPDKLEEERASQTKYSTCQLQAPNRQPSPKPYYSLTSELYSFEAAISETYSSAAVDQARGFCRLRVHFHTDNERLVSERLLAQVPIAISGRSCH